MLDVSWDAMRYFKSEEFDSPDKPGSGRVMDVEFMTELDGLRHKLGFPLVITSGFRTPAHNEKVGGSKNSSHMRGLAADIACTDNGLRYRILKEAMVSGFKRIGVYKTWIHLDYDRSLPINRTWVG